jgi:hypothetical protein
MNRHFETREMLRGIAEDYDRMAKTLDEIARTNEVLGK